MSLWCFIHVCKLKYNKLTFSSKNIQKYCKTFLESLNTVVLPCTAYYNKHSGLSFLETNEDENLLCWYISPHSLPSQIFQAMTFIVEMFSLDFSIDVPLRFCIRLSIWSSPKMHIHTHSCHINRCSIDTQASWRQCGWREQHLEASAQNSVSLRAAQDSGKYGH